jgi:hypothetical protein
VRAADETTLTVSETGCVEQLARFFPGANRASILVEVTLLRDRLRKLRAKAVLEFVDKEHAIFRSSLPIEFDDRVSLALQNSEAQVEAWVVAVQYHEGCKAVAVRFSDGPCSWMK